jgi:5-methylcytosine-specific restriction endonuclease McrA
VTIKRFPPRQPKVNRTWAYKKNAAIIRQNATHCSICGCDFTPDNPVVADHIIPRMFGGGDDLENLRPACRRCNGARGNRLRDVP